MHDFNQTDSLELLPDRVCTLVFNKAHVPYTLSCMLVYQYDLTYTDLVYV